MKTKIIVIYLLSLISVSCTKDKDGDTVPPVINLISPEEKSLIPIGDPNGLHFATEFTDDEMLASYKIEIHNNFDGHGHSKSETTPFYFQRSWSLSGKKNAAVHHHEIIIPEDVAPGNYHLLLYCMDATGNETNIVRNIILAD